MLPRSDQLCIVVNPSTLLFDVRARLERDRRVLIFDDLDAFERWRTRCTATSGLGWEVGAALREIGCDRASLPRELACLFERVARCAAAPNVRELARLACSERTFYRRWSEVLPVGPKRLLDRIRFLHAFRLIDTLGYSVKEAAAMAGYASADAFRAVVRRQKPTAFGRDSAAGARARAQGGLQIDKEGAHASRIEASA